MTVESKTSIKNILNTLYTNCDNWNTDHEIPIKYIEFKFYLMVSYELTHQERICKEKWKTLREFGVFSRGNKSQAIVNLDKVRSILEIPSQKQEIEKENLPRSQNYELEEVRS